MLKFFPGYDWFVEKVTDTGTGGLAIKFLDRDNETLAISNKVQQGSQYLNIRYRIQLAGKLSIGLSGGELIEITRTENMRLRFKGGDVKT